VQDDDHRAPPRSVDDHARNGAGGGARDDACRPRAPARTHDHNVRERVGGAREAATARGADGDRQPATRAARRDRDGVDGAARCSSICCAVPRPVVCGAKGVACP